MPDASPDPDLARRRTLPEGGRVEMRAMTDGWPLRTMSWAGGTRGSILCINGRGDFIEKFSDALHDWRARDFGVAVFDWRGQGGSGRLLADGHRGHSAGFDVLSNDLAEQVAWFRSEFPAPHYAVAHSMGGHLLLRYLERGGHDFERVVLLAPMTGLLALPIGAWAARRIAVAAGWLGRLENYAPGGGRYVPGEPGSVRQTRLTHDIARYGDEGWWVDRHPELAMGGVTNGWLAAAFASLDALWTPGALERIATPLLALLAEHEALVDNAATRRAVQRISGATVETIAGASHELVREVDAIRHAVLDRIAAFLG